MTMYIISNTFRGLHTMAQFYAFHNNALERFVPYIFKKAQGCPLDWFAVVLTQVRVVSIHRRLFI
jgi:hypothetical protein